MPIGTPSTNYKQQSIPVTVDASGDATVYSTKHRARIIGIIYTKDDFANGVDFTITTETSGIGVWTESDVNASKTVYPTLLVQNDVGVDTTQRDYIPLADERLKIVVASGGNATSGTFTLIFEG